MVDICLSVGDINGIKFAIFGKKIRGGDLIASLISRVVIKKFMITILLGHF